MNKEEREQLRRAHEFNKHIEDYDPPEMNKDVKEKYSFKSRYYECEIEKRKLRRYIRLLIFVLIVTFLHMFGIFNIWAILLWFFDWLLSSNR
jgi:hypothetical protein